MSLRIYQFFSTTVNMILGLVAFFLVLRLLLRFFSANPTTPFVQWIYEVSNFLMVPFAGIVPNIGIQTGIIDIVAIITLLVYLAIGYLIIGLLQNITKVKVLEEEEYLEEEYPGAVSYHEVRRKRSKTTTKD